MEYSIHDLRKCIIDYLTFNSGKIKSFKCIYSDITKPGSSHMCMELIDDKKNNRIIFMATCYNLLCDNIYKFNKDDILYLIHSCDLLENNFSNDITSVTSNELVNSFNLDFILDIATNIDLSHLITVDECLMRYAISNNKVDKLIKLMDIYKINYDDKFDGYTVIDIAVMNNNTIMVREIMKLTIQRLEKNINTIKLNNTKLTGLNFALKNRLEANLSIILYGGIFCVSYSLYALVKFFF